MGFKTDVRSAARADQPERNCFPCNPGRYAAVSRRQPLLIYEYSVP